MRGGKQRVSSTRDVPVTFMLAYDTGIHATVKYLRADILDRDIFVSQEHSGLDFQLQFGQRVLLRLGELADVALHLLDIFDHLSRYLGHDVLDIGIRKLERLRRPFVELFRVLAHSCIAILSDVIDDTFYRLRNLVTGLDGGDSVIVDNSLLQVGGSHFLDVNIKIGDIVLR